MKLTWHATAWEDYLWWQANDKQTLKRLNRVIEDARRNGHDGIGKPEPLKGNMSGWWSRRIDQEHRLVYRLVDDAMEIAGCRFHYGD